MKKVFTLASLLAAFTGFSQVEIDQRIELTGTGSQAKIEGIEESSGATDATNVKSVQSGTFNFGVASGGGSNAFAVSLSPAPDALTTGMIVYFKADAAISGPATLDVNSLGSLAIYKNGNVPLAANDIIADQVAAVIYDGTQFQLISSVPAGGSGPKACPSGYSAINKEYCISTNEQTGATFFNAIATCRGSVENGEAHLCSWAEWYGACTQSGVSPSLTNMTANGLEWVDDANSEYQPAGFGSAHVVGDGSCDNSMYSHYDGAVKEYGAWGAPDVHEYRCCFNR